MGYSLNWDVRLANGVYERVGLVGSTAFGLTVFRMPVHLLTTLIKAGWLDFRDIEAEGGWSDDTVETWLCETCADHIADEFSEQNVWKHFNRTVRTTSEQAASGLCFSCRAAKLGLPFAMLATPTELFGYDPVIRDYVQRVWAWHPARLECTIEKF